MIVGGGLSGLSAVLNLAKGGHKVVLLEAMAVGWGASGRDNGQVIPSMTAAEPDAIRIRYGEAGERSAKLIGNCASVSFDLVRGESIAPERTGWFQPAHSPRRVRLSKMRAAATCVFSLRRPLPADHRRCRDRRAGRVAAKASRNLAEAFPELGSVKMTHVWSGYIGMTWDRFPRIHNLGPDAWAWIGCNGRGVALDVSLGREMARAVPGEPVAMLALPVPEPSPLPFHSIARRNAPAYLAWLRRKDRCEIIPSPKGRLS